MKKMIVMAALTAFAAFSAYAEENTPNTQGTTNAASGSSTTTAGSTDKATTAGAAENTKGSSAMAEKPNDAQIAAIVTAANDDDIDAGKMAEKQTKNADVKTFAKQMVTDHTAVNKEAKELCKKLKVKPAENETSKALKKQGKDAMALLKKMKGAEFDKAYVDHEVAFHQQVLDTIDNVLVPNAQNAELKDMIVKTRPTIAEHLQHAKMLQQKLGSAGTGVSGSSDMDQNNGTNDMNHHRGSDMDHDSDMDHGSQK